MWDKYFTRSLQLRYSSQGEHLSVQLGQSSFSILLFEVLNSGEDENLG